MLAQRAARYSRDAKLSPLSTAPLGASPLPDQTNRPPARRLARARPRPRARIPVARLAGDRDRAGQCEAARGAREGRERPACASSASTSPTPTASRRCAIRSSDEKLDLLFVVAGISGSVPAPLHEVSPDEAARVFLINAYFPIAAAEAFADLLKPDGTVAFMSSRLGSIALNDYGSWETYRLSKAALNMGSRSFFHRHAGHAVLSISPGWVRTDMGGPSATFDVETSCRNVADAIARACRQAREPLCELRRHRIAVVDEPGTNPARPSRMPANPTRSTSISPSAACSRSSP